MLLLEAYSAMSLRQSLQRCWRDVHAASNHIFFCNEDARQVGRFLLTGAEPTAQI